MNQGYTVNSEQLGVTNLGKEWRWYKKELDTQRRKAKKEAERKANFGGDSRPNYHDSRGSGGGFSERHSGQTYYSRDRGETNTGGGRYGGDRYDKGYRR